MNDKQQYNALVDIIDEAGVGVLATVDTENRPRVRWMTAATEKSRDGAVFTVSYRNAGKISQLEHNPHTQWLFSAGGKNAIVDGQTHVVDNPAVKAGVMELLGSRLARFWEQDIDPEDIVVLETIVGEVHIQ
ncbi:pyridoxamine 5'-phosphate oxidase family protein [Spirochaeta africana]|uniref:Putative stress protein (General stress protein 26) n=1 Tax=Spirochaeta africana (strain ATCC 700263 / DSM 8902 / Z-7692) TaxID=889378 RepID=H9UK18_SPIAZ|nr:pyridoxamine 5'-phosphate oxidase family protein [Spirochaeta africana]AFG37861.1 putative stress protein (general stress protein 26) [Spirochaeta africana DSM 8902]